MNELKERIRKHEGCPLTPQGRARLYQDNATPPRWTIGYGWNLSDNGLPLAVAETLLDIAIDNARRDLLAAYPVLSMLDEVRQDALVELVYNMGITTVKAFVLTMWHVMLGEFPKAGENLRKSKWYQQVGKVRAEDIIARLVTGRY